MVDDASGDNTVQLAKSALAEHLPESSIAVRRLSSGSSGANFLNIIREVDPENWDYFFLCDQDDIWHPKKVERAIQELASSGADGYSCAVEAFWPDGRRRKMAQSRHLTELDYLFEGAGQGCTFAMSKHLFLEVQRFVVENESLVKNFAYHDWLIYLVARSLRFRWSFDGSVYLSYRQHQTNVIGAKTSFSGIGARLELIRSGWYASEIEKAINMADRLGVESPVFKKFRAVFFRRRSFWRQLELAGIVLINSRRKFVERLILFAAVLMNII